MWPNELVAGCKLIDFKCWNAAENGQHNHQEMEWMDEWMNWNTIPVLVSPFAFQSPHDILHSTEFLYFQLFVSVRAYQLLRSPSPSEYGCKSRKATTKKQLIPPSSQSISFFRTQIKKKKKNDLILKRDQQKMSPHGIWRKEKSISSKHLLWFDCFVL